MPKYRDLLGESPSILFQSGDHHGQMYGKDDKEQNDGEEHHIRRDFEAGHPRDGVDPRGMDRSPERHDVEGEPHPHVFLFDLAMAQQVDEHRPDAHDDDEGENAISGHFTAFLTGLTRATARASEARSR